jgi:ABC-type polysaccharide/polyol phosphate transport system ATPase subunit/peptidoglycan/LPS O-acetylase OafA/YrhL
MSGPDRHGVPRLDGLTSLRFVAAAMVVSMHTAGSFGQAADAERQTLQIAFASGVSFFFVLSGFILAYNYGPGPIDLRAFLRARVARIVPLYWAVLAFELFLDPAVPRFWHIREQIVALPAHLALMQAWWPLDGVGVSYFIAPAWSLSTEWAFYLGFPVLVVWMARRPRSLLAVALAAALAVVALTHLFAPAIGAYVSLLDGMHPLARVIEFVVGIGVGLAYRARPWRLGGWRAVAMEVVALAAVVATLAAIDPLARSLLPASVYLFDWAKHVIAAPAYVLLIAVVAASRGPLSRLLRSRLAVRLGEISFAMFLLHVVLFQQPVWPQLAERYSPGVAGLAFVAALLVLSWLAWRFIEVPARALLRSPRPAATPAGEVVALMPPAGRGAARGEAGVPSPARGIAPSPAPRIEAMALRIEFPPRRATGARAPAPPVVAVDGVSLAVDAGERVGIVGANGAGKSTLLRALAGIYPPCAGALDVRGRIMPLFDLGMGFETDASGRDNIVSQGMLFGYDRARMRATTPAIVEFAGLGEAIDRAVATYSSGMLLRLGFSIAAHCDGEIWLIDEIIGAGDRAFSERAGARLDSLLRDAALALVASHDVDFLARHCTRVIWLDAGRVVADGDAGRVLERYARGDAPLHVAAATATR